jgi:hypothetical protein
MDSYKVIFNAWLAYLSHIKAIFLALQTYWSHDQSHAVYSLASTLARQKVTFSGWPFFFLLPPKKLFLARLAWVNHIEDLLYNLAYRFFLPRTFVSGLGQHTGENHKSHFWVVHILAYSKVRVTAVLSKIT